MKIISKSMYDVDLKYFDVVAVEGLLLKVDHFRIVWRAFARRLKLTHRVIWQSRNSLNAVNPVQSLLFETLSPPYIKPWSK